MAKKLTQRQEMWALHFAETGNAAQAARMAGYTEKYADRMGSRNYNNSDIMGKVQEYLGEIKKDSIAQADEVMQYLTSVMRGESRSEIVVVEGIGDGCSSARAMDKCPDEKDRLKAAELIGKRYGIFKETIAITEPPRVVDDV